MPSAEILGALAARVRAGDRAAEAELAERLYPGILAVAWARLRDREAAREVAQDTMVALLRALREGRLLDSARVAAFAHGIAVNMTRVFRRQAEQHHGAEELRPEHGAVLPDDRLQREEETRLLREALTSLDPVDRRILSLTLRDGLSPSAIGVRVGLSAEHVRTRKSRSLKKVIAMVRKVTRLNPEGHLPE